MSYGCPGGEQRQRREEERDAFNAVHRRRLIELTARHAAIQAAPRISLFVRGRTLLVGLSELRDIMNARRRGRFVSLDGSDVTRGDQ